MVDSPVQKVVGDLGPNQYDLATHSLVFEPPPCRAALIGAPDKETAPAREKH
jgi:hypothetical protein